MYNNNKKGIKTRHQQAYEPNGRFLFQGAGWSPTCPQRLPSSVHQTWGALPVFRRHGEVRRIAYRRYVATRPRNILIFKSCYTLSTFGLHWSSSGA